MRSLTAILVKDTPPQVGRVWQNKMCCATAARTGNLKTKCGGPRHETANPYPSARRAERADRPFGRPDRSRQDADWPTRRARVTTERVELAQAGHPVPVPRA